jgi:predicted cupin superfamily sugar epimerase
VTAEEVIAHLKLAPLLGEGGFYRETHRSAHSTAIYFLLTPESHSRLHRLTGPEVYHFYLGDPVEMLLLSGDGSGEVVTLGPDLATGQRLQHIVPGGVWQGSRVVPGGRWALLGTTMAPPFEFADFTLGDVETLAASYGQFAELIRVLGTGG